MKVCTKCGDEKPLDEFYFDRRRAEHRPACKICVRLQNAPNDRARTPAKRAQYKRNSGETNPEVPYVPREQRAAIAAERRKKRAAGIAERAAIPKPPCKPSIGTKGWYLVATPAEIADYRLYKRIASRVRYSAHVEVGRAKVKLWKINNPDQKLAQDRNRRARLKLCDGRHTAADIKELRLIQRDKCAHSWCRVSIKSGYHVDHIMPLALGGSNDKRNLQLLCAPCNSSKGASHPVEWAQRNSLLI